MGIMINELGQQTPLLTVDGIEAGVRLGNAFLISKHSSSLANNATVTLLGKVGDKQIQWNGFDLSVSAGTVLIEFYESPTITNNGTAIDPINKNRSSDNISSMEVYYNPTISSNGTLLFDEIMLSVLVQGQNKMNGNIGIGNGWILSKNTDYIVRITNQSGSAISYNAKFTYQEL